MFNMDLCAITVVSLLMFYGRIAAEENKLGLDLDPSRGLSNRYMGYGSDQCCRRIDDQTTILRGISTATKKLTKDVGKMKTGVKDDISIELKRQAVDLGKLSSELKSVMTKQAVDLENLSSELKRQAVGQKKLSSELNEVNTSVSEISISLNKHTEVLVAHDARMNEQKLLLEKINSVAQETHGSLTGLKDCSDIRTLGNSTSGVYRVYPGSLTRRIQTADVYCDMTTPGGNWLVFQRRRDGSVNFERTWIEYLNGFGNPDGEFWLGNEALYLLNSNKKYKLRIDMEDFDGQKRYAEYSTFSVGSSADNYRLTVSGYTGDAGDSLSYQSGAQFSTKDADYDAWSSGSCSQLHRGAWWYKHCIHSNLNGRYLRGPNLSDSNGVGWITFRGLQYSLKMTEMKIAAVN